MKSIEFGLYQSCGSKGGVVRVPVFGLLLCGWCRWGVGRLLGSWSRRVLW